MTTAVATVEQPTGAALVERVVIKGDLSVLTAEERMQYYRQVCESVGLNPLTRPFDYIVLNGKLTLYCNKGGADQLRKVAGVSITSIAPEIVNDLYTVTAYGQDKAGRSDSDMGYASIKGLSGDALGNAMLKAVTKAKRRLTLSLVGLGMLDETEVESIPDATRPAIEHPVESRTEQVRQRLAARAAEREEVTSPDSGDAVPEEDDGWTYSRFRRAFLAKSKDDQPTRVQVLEAAQKLFPDRSDLEFEESKDWTLTPDEWRLLAVDLGLTA